MSDITTSTALIHPDSEREDESTGDHHQDKKNSQFDQFENIGETGVSSPRHTFKSVMVLTQFDPFGNISETGVFSPRTFKSVMVLISDPTIILNGIRSVISNNANADDLRDDIASLLIPEIKSDQAFMIVFPEFFREFFLEAKNTY